MRRYFEGLKPTGRSRSGLAAHSALSMAASIALHRKFGFRQVGVRERLGRMTHGPLAGEWRDVMLLERRGPAVV